jgi:hypothetical protein
MDVQGEVHTFQYLQFRRAMGIPFTTTTTFSLNAGMPDFPASSQSGTGMNKNSDARTSPEPE